MFICACLLPLCAYSFMHGIVLNGCRCRMRFTVDDMVGDGSLCHGRVRLCFVGALVQDVRTSSNMICIFELLIRIVLCSFSGSVQSCRCVLHFVPWHHWVLFVLACKADLLLLLGPACAGLLPLCACSFMHRIVLNGYRCRMRFTVDDMDGDGSICHGRVRLGFDDALVQDVRTSSNMICIFEMLIRIVLCSFSGSVHSCRCVLHFVP